MALKGLVRDESIKKNTCLSFYGNLLKLRTQHNTQIPYTSTKSSWLSFFPLGGGVQACLTSHMISSRPMFNACNTTRILSEKQRRPGQKYSNSKWQWAVIVLGGGGGGGYKNSLEKNFREKWSLFFQPA